MTVLEIAMDVIADEASHLEIDDQLEMVDVIIARVGIAMVVVAETGHAAIGETATQKGDHGADRRLPAIDDAAARHEIADESHPRDLLQEGGAVVQLQIQKKNRKAAQFRSSY